ncbi:hypothetical protein Y032_0668g1351 [Ancylostoma ceylanicum]|uniref:Uncharacterized protein n=1 Tax=Ancylostoma ceylanicum TaxID=53326 RepID=A0A016WHY7_9BILA|nr:hypothetical protein Y032_0668g1351 [Ancylostoma ceylanicum]
MVCRAEHLEESASLIRPVHLAPTSLVLTISKSDTRASVAIERTLLVHSQGRSVLANIQSMPINGVLDQASSSSM